MRVCYCVLCNIFSIIIEKGMILYNKLILFKTYNIILIIPVRLPGYAAVLADQISLVSFLFFFCHPTGFPTHLFHRILHYTV